MLVASHDLTPLTVLVTNMHMPCNHISTILKSELQGSVSDPHDTVGRSPLKVSQYALIGYQVAMYDTGREIYYQSLLYVHRCRFASISGVEHLSEAAAAD